MIERFWQKVDRTNSCWLWQGATNSKNYGSFYVGNRKTKQAHRFSYEIHRGIIPDGLCVLHKCDNPSCVNPEHLFLGTNKDNVMDRVKKGRSASPKGELSGKAKFTIEIVRSVRTASGTLIQIGRQFNMSKSQVSKIKNKKCWENV